MSKNVLFRDGFASRLKAAKVKSEMTEDKIVFRLFDKYGIDLKKGTIGKHFNAGSLPDVQTLHAYCDMFNVSADYLLFGTGEDYIERAEKEDLSEKLNNRDTVTALKALGIFSLIAKPRMDNFPVWSITITLPEDANIDSLKKKNSEGLKKELQSLLSNPNTRVYLKPPFVSLYFSELVKAKDELSSKDYWQLIFNDIVKIDTLHAPDIAGKYDLIKTEIASMMKKYDLVETLKYDYFSSKTDSLLSSQLKLEKATKEYFEQKRAAAETSKDEGNEVSE